MRFSSGVCNNHSGGIFSKVTESPCFNDLQKDHYLPHLRRKEEKILDPLQIINTVIAHDSSP